MQYQSKRFIFLTLVLLAGIRAGAENIALGAVCAVAPAPRTAYTPLFIDAETVVSGKHLEVMPVRADVARLEILRASTLSGVQSAGDSLPENIGSHKAVYDTGGKLLPWTSWEDAIGREIKSRMDCPLDSHQYPNCVSAAFLDGKYQPCDNDIIPCTQNGMGIISYLKYYEYTGKSDPNLLERAVQMGDYLIKECMTQDEGAYPRFPRSTGNSADYPLRRSSQGDAIYGENVIEPDKGGIVGYAFMRLNRAPAGKRYMEKAIHIADVLVENMRNGDAQRSPWPFRVDSINGRYWGERNGNMVFILRLFDELIAAGHARYQEPRDKLWNWIKTFQLHAPEDPASSLWIQFCEDRTEEDNRTSWAPLEMARYLIEKKDILDPEWKSHAEACIEFALRHLSDAGPGGVTLMRANDYDRRAQGGVCAKLGGVAAMFYAAGGGEKFKEIAYRNLNWMTYSIREDGLPSDQTGRPQVRETGWREDGHTDVIHNFVDAMQAVPEWAGGPRGVNARPEKIGFHKAAYDAEGKLVPWTSWADALEREMAWYAACPVDPHGYPIFMFTTFMDDKYKPYKTDIIPCTQDGMGILSYLKYWEFKGKSNPTTLEYARKMGDYLVKETLTPDEGVYPRFTRSTGNHNDFPLKKSSQADARYSPNVVQPDKGGIAGYALVKLYDATGEASYLAQAVHNADVLVKNMRTGNAARAPWPFRVDSVTGEYWGERNGNMVFILRLFDELIAKGRNEYQVPRDSLWTWIKTCQIPSPDSREASLWIQFFEDMSLQDNRTSWAPLEMARYLIEKKDALDPDWKQDAEKLIQFALRYFSSWQPGGVTTMAEQDTDMRAWGGACAKLGGVAAMFYAAGGGEQYKEMAYRNLTWMMYHIDADGCPAELTGFYKWLDRGGWQEDCHTDVVHNFMDAIIAVPEWGRE